MSFPISGFFQSFEKWDPESSAGEDSPNQSTKNPTSGAKSPDFKNPSLSPFSSLDLGLHTEKNRVDKTCAGLGNSALLHRDAKPKVSSGKQ